MAALRHLDPARAGICSRRRHPAQAVAPTWDDISKLAVIATIRTMLNYFLAKEISDPSSAPFRLAVSPNIP